MKKLLLGMTVVASLGVNSNLMAGSYMPYEGASCKGLMSLGDGISAMNSITIRKNMKKISDLEEKIDVIYRQIRTLDETELEEIKKLEKRIDGYVQRVIALNEQIQKAKKELSTKLTAEEKELLYLDNGFVMSEDCGTVYVLPPMVGEGTIMAAGYLGGIGQCSTYNFYDKMSEMTQRQILELDERMSTATTSEMAELMQLQNLLFGKVGIYQADKKKMGSEWVGFSANILLQSKWNKLVREYKLRNPEKRVVQMSVSDSKLSSGWLKESRTGDRNLEGVYNFMVPGQDKPDSTVFFNGSRSGLLQLNLHSACPLMEVIGKDYDFSNKTLADLNKDMGNSTKNQFAVDVVFEYPVYSKKGYSVKVNYEFIKEVLNKLSVKKQQFNVEKLHSLLFSQNSSNTVEVEVFDEGGNNDDANLNDYALEIKDMIQDKIAMEFLESFAEPVKGTLQVMLNGTVDNSVDYNEKNWRNIHHSVRHCRTTRSWFRKKRRCWTQRWTTKQFVTSTGSNEMQANLQFKKSLSESALFKGIITRKKSMTFSGRGE
jgi:hypothetical protein